MLILILNLISAPGFVKDKSAEFAAAIKAVFALNGLPETGERVYSSQLLTIWMEGELSCPGRQLEYSTLVLAD